MWRAGRTMAATACAPWRCAFMDLPLPSDCEVEKFQLSEDGPGGGGGGGGPTSGDLNGREAWRNWSWGGARGAMVAGDSHPAPRSGTLYSLRG